MKKVLFFLCLAHSIILHGQFVSGTVRGVLRDNDSSGPVSLATISYTLLSDSLKSYSRLSSDSGIFEISNLSKGTYRLTISHIHYISITKQILIGNPHAIIDLGHISMSRNFQSLPDVIVEQKIKIKLKGDTLSYNANIFKTKPNASAQDLLRKLPGVKVERGGEIKAMGEQVQKIYVDGKEFFNNDVENATLSITADMVDEVQVFEDKTESSALSSINDGSSTKSVNLKLKADKKQGVSGNIYAGYGPKNKYTAGIRTNFFKGSSTIALFAKTDNIDNKGNSLTHLASSQGDNLYTDSYSTGINFSKRWSGKMTAEGSYIYNNINSISRKNTYREAYLIDSTLLSRASSENRNEAQNHRATQKIVFKIDSLNTIIYKPVISFHRSQVFSTDSTRSSLVSGKTATSQGDIKVRNHNKSEAFMWTNTLIWLRRFKKERRTLSLTGSFTKSANTNNILSTINTRTFVNTHVSTDGQDGMSVSTWRNMSKYNFGVSYTEPITKRTIIEMHYDYASNRNSSDRQSTATPPEEGRNLIADNLLSNNFSQLLKSNRIGANFKRFGSNLNYQLGVSVQRNVMAVNNKSKHELLTQTNVVAIPTASLQLKFSRKNSLRIYYYGQNNQPNIAQQQDVQDITDYPYIRKGNPLLKPEFVHNVFVNYNSINTSKYRLLFASLSYNQTKNKIVNSINVNGIEQTIMPININGYASLNGTIDYTIPIGLLEGSNLSSSTKAGYTSTATRLNNRDNSVHKVTVGQEVNFSYDYDIKFRFDLSAGAIHNNIKYSVDDIRNNSYVMQDYSLEAEYGITETISIMSILNYKVYPNQHQQAGEKNLMWNASITKQVMKNNRGEITLHCSNLLNENRNVLRMTYDNLIEDTHTVNQGRLVILQFRYNFQRLYGK